MVIHRYGREMFSLTLREVRRIGTPGENNNISMLQVPRKDWMHVLSKQKQGYVRRMYQVPRRWRTHRSLIKDTSVTAQNNVGIG